VLDEPKRHYEMRARDGSQQLEFVTENLGRTGVTAQLRLEDLERRFAAFVIDGTPDLGRTAAPDQRNGAPTTEDVADRAPVRLRR